MRPDISYTSPLMNRHHQLIQTLDSNLRCVNAFKGRIEWVIVNLRCAATPDNAEWQQSDILIRTAAADLLQRGWVRYYTGTIDSYHQPICKNLATRHATGTFVINLDIDNVISIKDTNTLLMLGNDLEVTLYHGWDGKWGSGTSGMFGLPRSLYDRLGGYNEEFAPYGYDEYDLRMRAQALTGWTPMRFCQRQVIQNTDEERARHLATSQPLLAQNTANRDLSQENIRRGELVCVPRRSAAIALTESPIQSKDETHTQSQ